MAPSVSPSLACGRVSGSADGQIFVFRGPHCVSQINGGECRVFRRKETSEATFSGSITVDRERPLTRRIGRSTHVYSRACCHRVGLPAGGGTGPGRLPGIDLWVTETSWVGLGDLNVPENRYRSYRREVPGRAAHGHRQERRDTANTCSPGLPGCEARKLFSSALEPFSGSGFACGNLGGTIPALRPRKALHPGVSSK
ncbi:hypothetical protein Bbelb_264020 [Branchiostoma belcheri]|nr:hypothetical protein Bbelb_264020 [Branchiostoma belcheri]